MGNSDLLKKLDKVRNLFAYYGVIMMIYFVINDIDGHGQEYGVIPKIIMILLPFFTSSHFFGWKLYDILNKDAYTNDGEYMKTYIRFVILLTIVIIFFDIGMTYGIYRIGVRITE